MRLFKICVMMCAACLLCCSAVEAKAEKVKVYVPKEAIRLTNTGVIVYINHVPCKVKALHTDAKGFYIYDFEKVEHYCPYCQDDKPDSHVNCPHQDIPPG